MKFIRFFIFTLLISIPLRAQSPNSGGGANPPAPSGNAPEDFLPINDYVPLFFISGILIGAYFLSKSKSVVK